MGRDDGWPLTGRAHDLARITTALRRAGGVVLVGDAGVGKSRLAREVAAAHHAPELRWVAASPSTRAVPLGAFAPLLGAAVADGAGGGAPALARLATALRSPRRRALVVVDDAHALDDLSAAVVHRLAVDRAAQLLVTVRSSEPAPDAVTALWKDGLLERAEVEPLDERGTRALLECALGAQLEAETGWRLQHATQGNALWLRHLVEGERSAGRLALVAGRWRWEGDPGLSPVLRDLVDEQVGELDDATRRLLELVTLGEPLGSELLVELVGADALERTAARGLVVIDADRRRHPVRLAHPLYGEVTRARLDPWRLRRRRGDLVAALEATGARRRDDVLRLAVLALDGDLAVDPAVLTAAGHEAALLTALPLAERLLRAARDAGSGFEAQLAYGLTLCWQVRWTEGLRELDRAVDTAPDDVTRIRAECHRFVIELLSPTPARAVDRLRALLASLPSGRARADLGGVRAMRALLDLRLDEALQRGAAVLDDDGAAPHAITCAGYAVVAGRGLAGDLGGLDTVADRVVAVASAHAETALIVFNIRLYQHIGLGLAGCVAQARALLDLAVGPTPGVYGAMIRAAHDAWIAFHSGRPDRAARAFTDLRPFYPGHGGGWTSIVEAALAQARGMLGDAAGAREAQERAEEHRLPVMAYLEPDLLLARAWVAAAEGAVGPAGRQAVEAAEHARRGGLHAVEVLARHTAVCFGDQAQADRLDELARLVDGPRAPLAAVHARALADRDPAGLLAAGADLERAELVLPAAEAVAQAAVLEREAGRATAGQIAAARAAALAEQAGGARTPALALAASRLSLSAREREVATLAGAGLANREIAARLGVSVRTVEGHVYRACHRLGVPDRAALAALVAADRPTP